MLAIWFNTVLSVALFYTCFCRLVRTDESTLVLVRAAFMGLGAVSICSVVAPFIWAYRPQLPGLALLLAFTVMQAVTAHHWRHGVPCQFRKEASNG